jgi:peptide-methionine (R)-S-oxide reductase
MRIGNGGCRAGQPREFSLRFWSIPFVKRPFFNRLALIESPVSTRSRGIQRHIPLPGSTQFIHRHPSDMAHGAGVYRCAGCDLLLFTSQTRIASGVGWASFRSPVSPDNIAIVRDDSPGCERCEIVCPNCRAHLGYLFEDGSSPALWRYSVMLAALKFVPGK